jgi:hypothetical protein
MSGFNLCPLHPYSQAILKRAPIRAPKTRVPIAERARKAYEGRTISCETALEYCQKTRFALASSEFEIFPKARMLDHTLTALLISHLGSLFPDSRIGIWVKDDLLRSQSIIIIVTRKPNALPLRPLVKCTSSSDRLYLEFLVHYRSQSLQLAEIASREECAGGKGLVALYNLARDLGLKTIPFNAAYDAEPFYFWMDFGEPVGDGSARWVLKNPSSVI